MSFSALSASANETNPDEKVAQADQVTNIKIQQLDQQIILECINLARFNLHFHGSVNQKNFSQEWLYPMEREAGTALSFTNTMVDLRQRARGLSNPDLISRAAQKKGLQCALVGQAITGTSSGVQLATNLIKSAQARKQGFSPTRSIATVQKSVAKIDRLLEAREQLVTADEVEEKKQIYGLESRLLQHIRNQLVFEFKTWSIRSRSVEWSEDTFFAIDSLQGFTAMASSCIGLKAFTTPQLGGAAAITNLVASNLVMVNPVVRSLVGRYAANRQRHRLAKELPGEKPKSIDEVLLEWNTHKEDASSRNAATIEARELAFLVRRSSAMDSTLNEEVQRFERLRRIADQQAVSGPLIGLTGVTRGVLNATAFYTSGSSNSPGSSGPSHSRFVSNDLNFAGRVVQSTGQAYSLILTPVTEVRHYFYKRRLEKEGNLPRQILKARLDKLDELEARINTLKY